MSGKRNPREYLEKHEEEIDENLYEVLEAFLKKVEFNLADRSTYDYISRFRGYIENYSSDDFDPREPTEDGLRKIVRGIENEDDFTNDTKETAYKTLKTVYREYKDGEYYDLTDFFTVSGSDARVEEHMILSPQEVEEIIGNLQNIRDKAFVRLMYEVAATPGEILDAKVKDVNLEEEQFFVRGNKTHRDQTMELQSRGLKYLRDYLKMHPSVDDIYNTHQDQPLWVKLQSHSCKECGEPYSRHARNEEQTCGEYRPDETESVGYRSFYKAFNKAVERSEIERNIQMKYLRKSMITRVCEEGAGYERLNKFARWVPGSTQAQHYVALSGEELNGWIRDKFKDSEDDQKSKQVCELCGFKNDPDNIECGRCERPLDAPKSQRQKEAKEILNRVAQLEDDELKKAIEIAEMKG